MLSKRDVQLVRIAVRWRVLTPEQGEDVLFLCRKFEGKLSVEEIIRRRAYLEDAAIEELSEAASQLVARRPVAARPTVRAARGALVVPSGRAPTTYERAPAHNALAVEKTQFDPEGFRPASMPRIPISPFESQPLDLERSDAPRAGIVPRLDSEDGGPSRSGAQGLLGRAGASSAGAASWGDESDDDAMKTVVTLMPPLAPSRHLRVDDEAQMMETTSPLDFQQVLKGGDALMRTSDGPTFGPVELPHIGGGLPPIPSSLLAHQATTIYPELIADAPAPRRPVAAPASAAPRRKDPDALEGRLGPYTILRPIARGERGVLYRARGPDGIGVALKVLHLDASREPGYIPRFQADAARAAEIESPHVVRILDVGLVGVRPYLAMEYVEAWSLEERLDSGERPTLVESLSIARDIARALAAAEQRRVVHGDVSPRNVLVGRGSEGYLTNFVLARPKAGYAPPEVSSGRRPPSSTSDLYGLGATLFAMLTGRRPDEVGGASVLRELAPEASAEVQEIVARLLLVDPPGRPWRAEEVAVSLGEAAARAQAAFDARAARGFSPEARRRLLLRSLALGGVGSGMAVLLPLGARLMGAFESERTDASLEGALAGALALVVALLLFAALGLVRRGELPLPSSSAWLVRLQDGVGALGAVLLVAGLTLGPLAVLNLVVSAIAAALLASWIYGILLRRTIARLRPDRGVGRMLAVLGDPSIGMWRMVHAPMLATLALLASARFALLAYFAGG